MEKQRSANKKWAQLPKDKVGAELDQLGVDESGRLVLLELKDADASGVYYAPLQLLQYIWEWHLALSAPPAGRIRDNFNGMISARMSAGITPLGTPSLRVGLRPAIGFGADTRSPEICRRFALVLGIVNKHLPPGVPPVEVWARWRS